MKLIHNSINTTNFTYGKVYDVTVSGDLFHTVDDRGEGFKCDEEFIKNCFKNHMVSARYKGGVVPHFTSGAEYTVLLGDGPDTHTILDDSGEIKSYTTEAVSMGFEPISGGALWAL